MAQRRDERSYMGGVFCRQQLSVGKASHLFGQPAPFLADWGVKPFSPLFAISLLLKALSIRKRGKLGLTTNDDTPHQRCDERL